MNSSKIKRFFKKALPGIVTGAADNDPSGIATYSISGARYGFGQIWLMVLATPMLLAVQSMCGRIGLVQKKGLAKILYEQFHPAIAISATVMLSISNVLIIGADILAVSEGFSLLSGIHSSVWVLPVTLFVWYIMLFKNFRTLEKYMFVLVIFFLAYVAAAILAGPNWSQVIRSLVPLNGFSFSPTFLATAVAVLGTTITPYLFFWQVREEVEENKTLKQSASEAGQMRTLFAPGFLFSQLIAIFIMIATGATLFSSGVEINTAADAARALEPFAGNYATALFAIGIIAAGLLAIPVLSASTAYSVAEVIGLGKSSLNNKVHTAIGFYVVITLSLTAGVFMSALRIDPIAALFYSQILAGVFAVPLLALILILANKKAVVGALKNDWFDNLFGGLAFVVMAAAAVFLLIAVIWNP